MKIIDYKIVNGKKMFLIEEPIKKLGGVIEDNQGQWKYPGQITKINSPNITMKGVNYPVLGISNKGHKQLMMPEQEYTFDGQSVTEYPITAQAGTTVKVNINNKIKEFDISSQEYKDLYNSGKLMSYDKNTDSYVAPDLPEVTITAEAPQWLKDKRQFEKEYTKDKFIDEAMPKFSRSMGISADNMHPNNIAEYDKRINDKVAESILKRIPKIGNSEKERLKWYNSFTDKEREIIMNSNSYNLFEPAKRAYDINESNKAKEYSLKETFTDTKKLAQTVQGTPERFRFFPNAKNNIESYVNPGMFLGSMAKGLGNVPKDIKNENYGQAALSIATPLTVGALAGIGTQNTSQFINNLTNPLAGIKLKANLPEGTVQNGFSLSKLNERINLEPNELMGTNAYKIKLKDKWIGDFQLEKSLKDEGKIAIGNVYIKEPYRGKGFGKQVFTEGNKLLNDTEQGVLHSSGFFEGNDAKHVWNSLVKEGKAEQIGKDAWRFIEKSPSSKNFNSEIDWGKWNKEIPENKKLIQEYNLIEQQAKANGTWMKNPDGSTFKGTPEQFVQQNSENFKKAFGDSKLINPDGSYEPVVHSTKAKFDEFDKSYFGQTDEGYHGDGFYFSPIQRTGFEGEFYQRPYKWIDNKTVQGTHNYGKNKMMLYVKPDKIVGDFPVKPYTEIITDLNKPGNIKSAIGNNGMFDMSNPNIYKTLFGGLTIGTLGKKTMEKKEFGGKILNTKIENGKKYFLINE